MSNRNLGIAISYCNTILNMVCGLFLSSYLIRMLGQTDYGIYQTVCSFANYLVLLEFGTGTVITRNIARCRACKCEEEIQKNVSTVWVISLLLSLLLVLVSIFFYRCIPLLYKNTLTSQQIIYARKIFGFEAAYLIFSFFTNIPNGIMLGFEKYEVQPVVSIIKLVVRTVSLTVLVFRFRIAIIIVFVDVALCLLVLVFDLWYCASKLKIRFTIRAFDKMIFVDALPLSLAIMIQCIVNQANSNVDKFILGIKLSPESVAVYSIGLYIYSIFSSLSTIPISMYAPQVVKKIECGVGERDLEDFLIKPSRLITLVGGTIVFGFVAIGKQFLTLVYGEEYVIAWVVALTIMFPMLLNMSNGILINVLDAKNLRMSRSVVLLITTVANIILTFLWVDRWGMIGASAATAICTFFGQIMLMNIYYSKKLHVQIMYMYKKTFAGILLGQVVAAMVGYVIAGFIRNSLASFVGGGVTYIIVFFLLFIFNGKNVEEKAELAHMLNRLGKE